MEPAAGDYRFSLLPPVDTLGSIAEILSVTRLYALKRKHHSFKPNLRKLFHFFWGALPWPLRFVFSLGTLGARIGRVAGRVLLRFDWLVGSRRHFSETSRRRLFRSIGSRQAGTRQPISNSPSGGSEGFATRKQDALAAKGLIGLPSPTSDLPSSIYAGRPVRNDYQAS